MLPTRYMRRSYTQTRFVRLLRVTTAVLAVLLIVGNGHGEEGREGRVVMTERNNLVVIGASYAKGWNPEKLIGETNFINKGIDGQQSFEMLARFDADVLAVKPRAVVIWGFINDIFRSDRDRIEQTLARIQESLLLMIQAAKRAGITPILATEVTVRGNDNWRETIAGLVGSMLGKSSYHDYVNGHVTKINRWVRQIAAREGILLLDFEVALSDDHGIRRKEFAQPDGSHISPRGYEVLTKLTEDRLLATPLLRQ